MELESLRATPFHSSPGHSGVNAYDSGSRDFYQDLFHEAIFSARGSFSGGVFTVCFHPACRKNQSSATTSSKRVLRTGFVSDALMTDSTPSNLISCSRGCTAGIAGDWQNLPFLCPPTAWGTHGCNPTTPSPATSCFDNLRRSLLPAAALACLVGALVFAGTARPAAALAAGDRSACRSSGRRCGKSLWAVSSPLTQVLTGACRGCSSCMAQAALALVLLVQQSITALGRRRPFSLSAACQQKEAAAVDHGGPE